MRRIHFWSSIILLSAAVILLSGIDSSAALQRHYTEDFSTTAYKDTLNTTALWDTTGGKLGLFPWQPAFAGSLSCFSTGYAVFVEGDVTYLAAYPTDLVMIDNSDPSAPSLLGAFPTPGSATDVVVDGDYAYIADYHMGLTVVDVSDLNTPVLADNIGTASYAEAVAVDGDCCYIIDGQYGLFIFDVSDQTAVTYLYSAFGVSGYARDLCVAGDLVYVASDYNLTVVDVSTPTAPYVAGSIALSLRCYDVEVAGNTAYISSLSGGAVIDVSDPTAPSLITYDAALEGRKLYVSGNLCFVAHYTDGIKVVDIGDPAVPALVHQYTTVEPAYDVAFNGHDIYLVDGSSFEIIEFFKPTYPVTIDCGGSATSPVAFDIEGNTAYVVHSGGMQVYDISDPSNLSQIGSYTNTDWIHDIVVRGDYAYAAGLDSMYIFDVSDPTAPHRVCDMEGTMLGLDVAGDYAYFVGGGLYIYSIATPTYYSYVGQNTTPNYPQVIEVRGDYAYLADDLEGLYILDVSDPAAPAVIGVTTEDFHGVGLDVCGDYAYVAADEDGLFIVDISDPSNPAVVASYDPGYALDVDIAGDIALVACYIAGFALLDISDPTSPEVIVLTEIYDGLDETAPYRVAAEGRVAYMTAYGTAMISALFAQEYFEGLCNKGQSVEIVSSVEEIRLIKMSTVQAGCVEWQLSTDGGSNWFEVTPDGTWRTVLISGSEMLWRSIHTQQYSEIDLDPACAGIQLEWLFKCADIDSIVDVPGDQGGWARIHFTRSSYDMGDLVPYNVWRRVDDPVVAQAVVYRGERQEKSDDPGLIQWNGRGFLDPESAPAADFPAGTWEILGSFIGDGRDQYIYLAPTQGDSSGSGIDYDAFVVSVFTGYGWHHSVPDSGYSVDNIAPGVPLGMMVAYNTGSGNQVTWDPSPEQDFQYYRIYRGDSEDFVPGPGNLVHQTATESWSDPEYDGWDVYYKVTALDHAGNESDAASPESVTGDDVPSVPKVFALYQNNPNPFNPTTTIRFDLPSAVHVKLCVYNVKGELVATLVDQHMKEGRKEISWVVGSDHGGAVTSGIYFYRLVAGDFVQTRKMVLLK